jgi:hypothetical protein
MDHDKIYCNSCTCKFQILVFSMGVLAPRSSLARPPARPPIDMSRNMCLWIHIQTSSPRLYVYQTFYRNISYLVQDAEITNISSSVSFCEDLLVLVLVSNQELGTGGPEECSQAKISEVENIIHTCRDRPIWVQPILIPIYVPGRFRYIWIYISATDTNIYIFPKLIFGR